MLPESKSKDKYMKREIKFHSFEVDVAVEHGILEAIFLQYFRIWIDTNRAEGRNYHDGRYWTYNSIKAFCELFPYASESTIRRTLKNLKDAGLIITGNFNKVGYDRTKWYALSERKTLDNADLSKTSNPCGQNEQMDVVNVDRPIPSTYTSTYTSENISSSLHSEDIYSDEPKKADKEKTKLTMKDVYKDLPEELADTLKDFEDMRKAIKKVATPNAMKLILKDLDKLAGDDTEKKIAILEQSIKNSWQGVFPLREEQSNGTKGHTDFGRGNQKRKDVAERFTRSYDDFPRFPEAGETRPDTEAETQT